jgi:hypothetical protein
VLQTLVFLLVRGGARGRGQQPATLLGCTRGYVLEETAPRPAWGTPVAEVTYGDDTAHLTVLSSVVFVVSIGEFFFLLLLLLFYMCSF